MDDKMKLWNAVCKTNPAHTKKLKLGRTITAIDPYRQVEAATAQFGPAGEGWGWSVAETVILPTNEIGILVRLWHGDPGKYIEQWGQASFYINKNETMKDKDCFKKATTDGVTKCLSYLGFNADVFLGQYDDNKYVQQMQAEFAPEAPAAPQRAPDPAPAPQAPAPQAPAPQAAPTLDANSAQWVKLIDEGKNQLSEILNEGQRELVKRNLKK